MRVATLRRRSDREASCAGCHPAAAFAFVPLVAIGTDQIWPEEIEYSFMGGGVSVGAPFSMVLLAVLTVGVGAVNASIAGIAVVTAYTLTVGLGWFGLPSEHVVVDIEEATVQAQLFTVSEELLEPEE